MSSGAEPDAAEPRSRAAAAVRAAVDRTTGSAAAILQLVVAVTIAYAVTHYLLGHQYPIAAVTVTLSSLGLVLDARPRRVLEMAIAMTIGIALSEVILLSFGQGIWQFALTVLAALLVTRALSPVPGLPIFAAVQAALVSLLPVPDGGPFTRTVDALVGGAVALACTAFLPRDPRRAARREALKFFAAFQGILSSIVAVLRLGDTATAEQALGRARTTQPLTEGWRASLDSAAAVARISPFLRRHRGELEAQQLMHTHMDHAVRNLRVVSRRLSTLPLEGPRPELAELFANLQSAVVLLAQSIDRPELRPAVRQGLVLVAITLDPRILSPGRPLAESAFVLSVRPLVLDLLAASGMPLDEARRTLPDITT
ncbi:FUSC family protein [Herbiconiux moechotypicola]|uniref:Integral membrane bound transporter domain-containing protein n=1 Tax=Herbiconiux moechotypicola TaxID=637393 RepID=A0ABN3DTK0_9MICO|nr:FUSC family protein [Herbiconiux moechotypicola]MCS5730678.1 FUSC family protein [Herbiconiux moechotypicola]